MTTTLPSVRRAITVVVVALAATACGGDSATTSDTTTTTAPTTTASSTTASSTTAPATTAPTTAPATTAPTTTVADDDLPGEPFDIAPQPGTALSVLGVRHDDVLNVRSVPGLGGDIIATLAPTADDAVATGESRKLPSSVWWQITTAGGVTGWVSAAYTAITGDTTDATARILADLTSVGTGSIEAVGLAVAESQAQGEATQRIEMVIAPTEGDLGEVTFDVVGLGDDAVAGLRLHVFVVDEAGDGTWALRTVEETAMCSAVRGGTPGSICP